MQARSKVVILLTHRWSEVVFRRFLRLQRCIGSAYDFIVAIDAADTVEVARWENALRAKGLGICLFPFVLVDIESRLGYPAFTQGKLVPGSAHFPILDFSRNYVYEQYWVIEHDVEYTGNWADLFSAFESDSTDLICTHLARVEDIPNWYWWKSLRIPRQCIDTVDDVRVGAVKGFFPFYRISRQALECVHRAHCCGWRGHFEVLLPTAVRMGKLGLKDFNDSGVFYGPGCIKCGEGSLPLSSFRWRPEVTIPEMRASKSSLLFHPVKA